MTSFADGRWLLLLVFGASIWFGYSNAAVRPRVEALGVTPNSIPQDDGAVGTDPEAIRPAALSERTVSPNTRPELARAPGESGAAADPTRVEDHSRRRVYDLYLRLADGEREYRKSVDRQLVRPLAASAEEYVENGESVILESVASLQQRAYLRSRAGRRQSKWLAEARITAFPEGDRLTLIGGRRLGAPLLTAPGLERLARHRAKLPLAEPAMTAGVREQVRSCLINWSVEQTKLARRAWRTMVADRALAVSEVRLAALCIDASGSLHVIERGEDSELDNLLLQLSAGRAAARESVSALLGE